jgi:hypothetical protein
MCDRKTSNSVASMAHVRATFVVEMLKKDLQPNVNARAHSPNAPIRSEAKVMVNGEKKLKALFELVITCSSHATNVYQSPELTTLQILAMFNNKILALCAFPVE